jgi:hypothetical protein
MAVTSIPLRKGCVERKYQKHNNRRRVFASCLWAHSLLRPPSLLFLRLFGRTSTMWNAQANDTPGTFSRGGHLRGLVGVEAYARIYSTYMRL